MRKLFLFLVLLVLYNLFQLFDGDETNFVESQDPALDTYQNGISGKKSGEQLYIIEAKQRVYQSEIKDLLKLAGRKSGVIFYNWSTFEDVTASAPGTDKKHHLVNSYLVGYHPFTTDNIWIPWKTIALRKQYQYDHITTRGRKEIWQSSREAFKYPKGDCEDHAIALADWLIAMGYDARVVIGEYKNSGHAWVVLLNEGKTFLLEATRKNGLNSMKNFPLAALQLDYRPAYMFNRTTFWKNTGSRRTVKYASSKWVKKSKYKRKT